ncbi:MAG: S1C family serine protease [Planctomycetaceae bacterium]
MPTSTHPIAVRRAVCCALILATIGLARSLAAQDKTAQQHVDPTTVADLRALETAVKRQLKKILPYTVSVRIGGAQGSGVIVTEDGYVLTAAHVTGEPGRNVIIKLADGREVRGKSLGVNRTADAGLIKINGSEKWPHAEMGDSGQLTLGQWCLALGHPGGFRKGRPPVARLGRIIAQRATMIQTDCTLVGGDSGGPLFDLQGRVIGVHSRIGASTDWNFHVPVQSYQANWERLASAEAWGGRPGRPRGPILGILGEDHKLGCRVIEIIPDLPAQQAGLQSDDVITSLDGKPVKGIMGLQKLVRSHTPGDVVRVEFLRGEQQTTKKITLSRAP